MTRRTKAGGHSQYCLPQPPCTTKPKCPKVYSSIAPEAVVVFRVAVGAVSAVRATMATAVATMVAMTRGMTAVMRRTGRPVLNKNKLGGGGCAVHVTGPVTGSRIWGLRGTHGQRLRPSERLLQVRTRTSGCDGDRHRSSHGWWHLLWNLLLGKHWQGNE